MTPENGESTEQRMDIGDIPRPGKSDQVKRRGRKKKRARITSKRKYEDTDDNDSVEEHYDVEQILDHKLVCGKVSEYLVKWVGWENPTWEPIENVVSCLELVVLYFVNMLGPNFSLDSQIPVFRKKYCQFKDEEIETALRDYIKPDGDDFPNIDINSVEERMQLIARLPFSARDAQLIRQLQKDCMALEIKKRRTLQLENLAMWENEMNNICTDGARISVRNYVDLDMRPLDFKYINKYKQAIAEKVSEDPPIGCDCISGCTKGKCFCLEQSEDVPYFSNGLLRVGIGIPIFECNSKCKCGPRCFNRVLQKGRTVPVTIFKTTNGCGWGVQTDAKILKGQFVTEYVGEVIPSEEATKRDNQNGSTYLFDLDFNTGQGERNFPYTVDAAEYGNVAHFINHSCNPNLSTHAVWVDCLDVNMPRLGLYANKLIRPGEELTLDYLCQPIDKTSRAGGGNRTYCKCNSANCRTYLY